MSISWGFTQNNKLHIIYSPQAKNWHFYSYSVIYFCHHLGCFNTEEDSNWIFFLKGAPKTNSKVLHHFLRRHLASVQQKKKHNK